MQQSVEGCRSHHRVTREDVAPLRKRLVARQDNRTLFIVPVADDLEHQTRFRRAELQVADLINDEQFRARAGCSSRDAVGSPPSPSRVCAPCLSRS